MAIQICYDIEFPELTRIAAERGAQIIFVPFCTDERYAYLRVRYCAQARCVENHVYVAIAGSVGNLPHVDSLDIHYAVGTPRRTSCSNETRSRRNARLISRR